MSEKSDQFEERLVEQIMVGSVLPERLPSWMIELGVQEGARVKSCVRQGASGGKVDVRVDFDKGEPLLISAKLVNADYYGNWYSHTRVIKEFGEEVFNEITVNFTDWANNTWVKSSSASLFVGVSICFGRRTGKTCTDFFSLLGEEGMRKIVQGDGEGKANCLLVSDTVPKNIIHLIDELAPIDSNTLLDLGRNFKIIYRPINPMSEKSNRGKCVYTQFKAAKKLSSATIITSLTELMKYGSFFPVTSNSLNHNRVLDSLESYNIFIPRKE